MSNRIEITALFMFQVKQPLFENENPNDRNRSETTQRDSIF